MLLRILACLLALLLVSGGGWAQVIVDENFNSYANAAALSQVWVPTSGDGTQPAAGPIGILTPCVSGDPCPPLAPYDGTGDPFAVPPVAPLADKAVVFSNLGVNVNEWDNDNTIATAPFNLIPSATQNVRYSADIFDDGGVYLQSPSGRRFSVGLRNDTIDRDPGTFGMQAGLNLVELGMWQATTVDPTTGVPSTDPITYLAYRVVLFSNPQPPLIQNPDWQYFVLPPEFDDPNVDHNGDGKLGNGDGIVDNRDVGPGWHQFAAEISDDGVRLTLDLFRDGTVDAEVFHGVSMATDPLNPSNVAGFTSLRMGGPSGVSMNEFTMVDNIRLEMVDVGTITGDFNNDGLFDCADINLLAADILGPGTPGTFDLTGDGNVDLADRDAWLAEAGDHNLGPGRAYLLGDANLDGGVDGSDFGVWNAAKFTTPNPPAYCAGDFNIDGGVDGSDFGVWNANKFQSADGAVVPEPATSIFALFSAIAVFTLRRMAR